MDRLKFQTFNVFVEIEFVFIVINNLKKRIGSKCLCRCSFPWIPWNVKWTFYSTLSSIPELIWPLTSDIKFYLTISGLILRRSYRVWARSMLPRMRNTTCPQRGWRRNWAHSNTSIAWSARRNSNSPRTKRTCLKRYE